VPGPQGASGPEGRHVIAITDNGDGRAYFQMSDNTNYGPFSAASGPAGAQGSQGPPGNDGAPGAQGPPGQDGEVTTDAMNAAIAAAVSDRPTGDAMNSAINNAVTDKATHDELNTAIGSTARNPASIGTYTGDFSDPPTQSELRDFRDWCNSFFSASAR
jgi:hypothetical protein